MENTNACPCSYLVHVFHLLVDIPVDAVRGVQDPEVLDVQRGRRVTLRRHSSDVVWGEQVDLQVLADIVT